MGVSTSANWNTAGRALSTRTVSLTVHLWHICIVATGSLSTAGDSGQAFSGLMVIRRGLWRHSLFAVFQYARWVLLHFDLMLASKATKLWYKRMFLFFCPALFIFVVFQCIHEARSQSCIPTNTDYVCKEIPKGRMVWSHLIFIKRMCGYTLFWWSRSDILLTRSNLTSTC